MEARFNTVAKRYRNAVWNWRTRGTAKMSLWIWGRWVLFGRA